MINDPMDNRSVIPITCWNQVATIRCAIGNWLQSIRRRLIRRVLGWVFLHGGQLHGLKKRSELITILVKPEKQGDAHIENLALLSDNDDVSWNLISNTLEEDKRLPSENDDVTKLVRQMMLPS